MTSIADWLAALGLGEYAERFTANAIDMSIIGELTDQDLKELEIPIGHRRKILKAIADSARLPPAAAAPVAIEEGAQRRQLTVMFCDLVGSSALSAALDPEDMRRVIAAYQRCIADVVERNSGMIARHTGDGALIYFGYPQAHEDDAEQAVHTGLALVDAIPKLNTGIDVTLGVCVGIATGTVVVGDLLTTESGFREHVVIGDAPNLAARLQSVARPGTVVVCANTRQLTDGYFDYRDLGTVVLKGWTDPVPTWQALSTSGALTRFEAHRHEKLMPLLGRDEEVGLLMHRWRSTKDGDGRAVLLTGEPGIGKSHIALAFDELLRSERHITLSYHCSSHHTNSALFPFINQIQRAAGIEWTDSPQTKLTKVESMFEASGGTSAHNIALLGNLLSLPPHPKYPLPAMTPQRQKEATLVAMAAILDGLSRRAPVLVIFEDVHWIDPTSLELLTLTVERVAHLRILLLMTARPEFSPPWPGHAHVSTMLLTRLGRRDGAALVARITGGKSLPEEVLGQILARTDGVPLFIEELTKSLLESGQLRERDHHYVLERALPSLAIPMTLHASLMARLDRLAPVREVAQIGAVIGREFSYELLNAVAGLPKIRLDEALEQLTRSQLIFARGLIPQAVYTFRHALVRDAAYEGLLKSRRAQLHAALAQVLEQNFPDLAEAQPEIVAHHLGEAGLLDRAMSYWLSAGRKAAQRSTQVEAIAHLQRGLDALRSLASEPSRDRMELDFLMVLGPCLIATQGPAGSEAMASFARARELCEALGDPPEYLQVMFWLTTASVMRGELPLAQQTIAALLDRAERRDDRPALLNAIRGKAMILMFMGQLVDAKQTIDRAYDLFNNSGEADRLAARAAGQDAGVADLALMSWILWLLGQPDSALKCIHAALQRADEIGHAHTQAYARYYACVLYALHGQPDVAGNHAKRCIELSEAHGFRQWLGLSRSIKGICAALMDSSWGSLEDVKTAMEEYRRAGYQLGITALFILLCLVLLLRDELDAALEIVERGLSTIENNSERIFEAELYRLKASILQRGGSADASAGADSLLQQALRVAGEQQAKSLELRVACDIARQWAREGKRKEASDLLAPICGWFAEGADTRDLVDARTLLARL